MQNKPQWFFQLSNRVILIGNYLSRTAYTDSTNRYKAYCELVPVFSIAAFKWLCTVDCFKP